ncbi:MAG: hypothetical protein P8L85_12360 [Rubripirellula sp.]|nr:hypothetical protein [Rubripirellula sp.]
MGPSVFVLCEYEGFHLADAAFLTSNPSRVNRQIQFESGDRFAVVNSLAGSKFQHWLEANYSKNFQPDVGNYFSSKAPVFIRGKAFNFSASVGHFSRHDTTDADGLAATRVSLVNFDLPTVPEPRIALCEAFAATSKGGRTCCSS